MGIESVIGNGGRAGHQDLHFLFENDDFAIKLLLHACRRSKHSY